MTEPEITEVTEKPCSSYNPRTKAWEKWVEPLLVSEWHVSVYYDYHGCCGRDSFTFNCATESAARQLVTDIKANKVKWLKYDPEELESYRQELEEDDA